MMADDASASSEAAVRWTCEACGCHTNTESDDPISCGVCGTRRVSSLLLRRGILASSSGFENHHQDDEDDVEDEEEDHDEDDENSDEDDDEEDDDEEDNDSQNENEVNNSLLESSSASPSRRVRRNGGGGSQRNCGSSLSVAASGGSSALSVAPILLRPKSRRSDGSGGSRGGGNTVDPDELLAVASANAGAYTPHWSAAHHGASIKIDVETGQIACLAEGGEEGRSVRALEPLPSSGCPSESAQRKGRLVCGWRIVFDHPTRDKPRSLGGCYLVGVTTDQFADFGERSGLQQSRLFWGVEDGGRRYEGGSGSSNLPRRGGSSGSGSGGIAQLSREDAPRNSDNVLFGSREVLTVVADLESRTLSYWREGTFLGTLVSGIPKQEDGISLYPVAVPFNAGVCVAICGLDSDPLAIMAEFHAAQKVLRERKNDLRRQALLQRKVRLLKEVGRQQVLSAELTAVLRTIFSWYAARADGSSSSIETDSNDKDVRLGSQEASRLWYRCGLRLSHLRTLLMEGSPTENPDGGGYVKFESFVSTIQKVVDDEEQQPSLALKSGGKPSKGNVPEPMDTTGGSSQSSDVQASATLLFEVGDKVEVCEGYDRYGDAASGPLRPGDLGSVLEVQRGPRGDRQSIRVLYNGRRWWYQPQALLSERSGLVESSSIRFLSELLRSHGYDADLNPLVGKQVTCQSWKSGDLVCLRPVVKASESGVEGGARIPGGLTKSSVKSMRSSPLLGRVVTESPSSSVARRESGMVNVVFCTSGPPKKVSVDRLLHTDFYHGVVESATSTSKGPGGVDMMLTDKEGCEDDSNSDSKGDALSAVAENTPDEAEGSGIDGGSTAEKSGDGLVNIEFAKRLSLMSKLDKPAISSLIKECRTPLSLARLYAAGLPESVLKAIEYASENECEASGVSSLGALVIAVSRGLFPEQTVTQASVAQASGASGDTSVNSVPVSSDPLFEEGGDNTADASRTGQGNNRLGRDLSGSAPDHQLRASNHPQAGISVRELVRDLGVGPEQRRGVLLALMASAQHAHAARSSIGRIVASSSSGDFVVSSSDEQNERGRHLLSPFGRLSAEAAAFGFPSSNQDQLEGGSANMSGAPPGPPSSAPSTSNSGSNQPTWSRSLLRATAASSCSGLGRTRTMNASMKWLIQNGLLLDSPPFVKKNLSHSRTSSSSSTDVAKVRDEEDNSILFLAVAFGCSNDVIQMLVSAGCGVSKKELEECARTNQHSTLRLLLQQTVYTPNSINVADCSPEVIDVLTDAVNRQIQQEEAMRNSSVPYASRLLEKFVDMALRFRLEGRGKENHARTAVEVLVGEVLLHAIHQSQNQALESTRSNEAEPSTSTGDDGRIPAFPTSASSASGPGMRGGGGQSGVLGDSSLLSSKPNIRCTQLSLIDILPAAVFHKAFTSSASSSSVSNDALTAYLTLTESYLWKKDMKDAVVGLTLASSLLNKGPSPQCGILMGGRYGVGDLASTHIEMADEALSEIRIRGKGEKADGDADPAAVVPVVKCPKGHTTILHLTRHSSFRCDLCGKGVEQGKPMHGCRECDWDACEACTDKAEGGLVKWRHIKRLAHECQDKLCPPPSSNSSSVETENTQKNLTAIAQGLRRRDPQSVGDLGDLLNTPGEVTLFEFVKLILPALHAALAVGGGISGNCGANFGGLIFAAKPRTTKRRSKKPRVGGGSSKKQTKKSNKVQPDNPSVGSRSRGEDWIAFVRSLLLLLGPCVGDGVDSFNAVVSKSRSISDSFVEDAEEDVLEEGSHDGEENVEEQESSTDSAQGVGKKRPSKYGPEILRRLHATLTFHERVAVAKYQCCSSSGESGGELQSLLLPFEIELCRVPASAGSVQLTQHADGVWQQSDKTSVNSASYVSCSDLQGAVVHMEPLMPLAELQSHVLRCCRVRLPAYLQYCRRLAQERAIIAERPTLVAPQADADNANGSARDEHWRVARVVAYDERIGAHVVRYASNLVSAEKDLFDAEEELLESENQRTVADQLEFNGREAMVILAARDYCILHRDKHDDDGFMLDQDSGVEDVMMSDVSPHELEYVEHSTPEDHYMTPSTLSDTTRAVPTENDSVSALLLPVGTRVESNVNTDDCWKVFTIISSCFEVAGIANILNDDLQSLTSQVESSVRSALNDSDNASDSVLGKLCRYGLVSDSGEVTLGVPGNKIRGHDTVLHQRCLQQQRGHSSWRSDSSESQNFVRGHSVFDRGIPIANLRRASSTGSNAERQESPGKSHLHAVGVLRRTWSALSPIQSMCPLELNGGSDDDASVDESSIRRRTRKMSIGGDGVEIAVDLTAVEQPPILTVGLSLDEAHPTVPLANVGEATLFSGLRHLAGRSKEKIKSQKICIDRNFKVFYSVSMRWGKGKGDFRKKLNTSKSLSFTPPWIKRRWVDEDPFQSDESEQVALRNRDISDDLVDVSQSVVENEMDVSISRSTDGGASNDPFSDVDDSRSSKGGEGFDVSRALASCDGMDDVSVQCLQLLNFFGDTYATFVATKGESSSRRNQKTSDSDRKSSTSSPSSDEMCRAMFVSDALTNKLLEQLEDPLSVVGGALPDWCSVAPAFAPRVFCHSSRRLLLERAGFGVSRAALRQQEAKVAVGPLRQRMAALRGRAVELVGEAFSGGAADPTALQLQADELYGMEEALAARVSAAFRAQRWDERSLQCAKAAVRRTRLLSDAAAVMERYANDASVNRRRLEVRFEGESGFDAASGDEAGVTRGFYADVAEALLSCERVSGISSATSCPPPSTSMSDGDKNEDFGTFSAAVSGSKLKLPLWIPDFDPSGRVVIPTPRAGPMSGLGIFPRPLAAKSPLRAAVQKEFRFMGRLFAAAMRDGFVFPLPLSVSFLKLVQSRACVDDRLSFFESAGSTSGDPALGSRIFCRHSIGSSNSSVASDYVSHSSVPSSASSSPVMSSDDSCSGSASVLLENVSCSGDGAEFPSRNRTDRNVVLNSEDLPRPGFLGGEVYAVERFICAALDRLEENESSMSREKLQELMREVAADKSFARKALGKSYDCSFEDYFEGKTFVDPLDPSQGEEAYPLCRDGAKKAVTIENVREWVLLAKQFILHDGVIAQAVAFRQGVNDFFSADALLLLTPEELQRDVCGGGDNVDTWDEDTIRSLFKLDGGKGAAEALVAVAAMGGEGGAALSRRFGPSSPTIGYLVKSLLEATSTQRRQFLSFVTSVPIVTPGQIEVVPVVSPSGEFLPMSDSCLPRANTCARRLYLPKFENFECFSQVLYSVVREESRFKGFFEWRG